MLVSKGPSAHAWSWAYKAARQMVTGTGKLSVWDRFELTGAVNYHVLVNSYYRMLYQQQYGDPKSAQYVSEAFWQEVGWSFAAGITRSQLWWLSALGDAMGITGPATWFNRAMHHRLCVAAYEDDLICATFLEFQSSSKQTASLEKVVYAPLLFATRTWFGAFRNADPEQWVEEGRRRVRMFLDDNNWRGIQNDAVTWAQGIQAATIAKDGFFLDWQNDNHAQSRHFESLDATILSHSLLSLALDFPPPFSWANAAATVRELTT